MHPYPVGLRKSVWYPPEKGFLRETLCIFLTACQLGKLLPQPHTTGYFRVSIRYRVSEMSPKMCHPKAKLVLSFARGWYSHWIPSSTAFLPTLCLHQADALHTKEKEHVWAQVSRSVGLPNPCIFHTFQFFSNHLVQSLRWILGCSEKKRCTFLLCRDQCLSWCHLETKIAVLPH